jgi:hypothetical protein
MAGGSVAAGFSCPTAGIVNANMLKVDTKQYRNAQNLILRKHVIGEWLGLHKADSLNASISEIDGIGRTSLPS